MQGKYRVYPAPKEPNVALVILAELNQRKTKSRDTPSNFSIVSARYVAKQEEQCCVVQ